ncbi:ZIP family metal transporter [Candidatus Woesearchaeota archaeon]|nr:ZIP family metal transporter [Candidatus Woesearchaeota archaeon]
MLLWILGSTFIISLISLIGVFLLGIKDKFMKKIILLLVGLSAGSFIGDAFLHLLPEAVEFDNYIIYIYLILGFCLFFIIERILHWHHCHKGNCDVHTFTHMSLIGDGIHNFIDGLIIAGSFLVNIPLGISTSIAILFHEIPQEIGDFGVLIHGGFSKFRAILFNFISAVTAMIGGLVGYFIFSFFDAGIFLLPFAAGGFIYIGASDLIPELHKEKNLKKSFLSFLSFLTGICLMILLRIIFE